MKDVSSPKYFQENQHARGRAQRTMEMHPPVSEHPLGDWREPPCSKSFWGWGSGGRVFFQKAAGSRNQISRRSSPARMEADGGVSWFHAAEERPVTLSQSCSTQHFFSKREEIEPY